MLRRFGGWSWAVVESYKWGEALVDGRPIFRRLHLAGWRQFEAIDIEFHPRLTVITGANGAGKSTLLNILSQHVGVSRPYLGVPNRKAGFSSFFSGIFGAALGLWSRGGRRERDDHLGYIEYSNDVKSRILIPINSGLSYSPQIENQQPVLGFHMPSHRLLPNYQSVPHIPFAGIEPAHAFSLLINETYTSYAGGHTGESVLFQLKKILAAWAAIGEGNSTLSARPAQYKAYIDFVDVLRKILPEAIGFEGLTIDPPEILLKTKSGTFLIDAASGGLVTLIEIAALIFTCSIRDDVRGNSLTVTFDEPENHLHPALQRSLLPTLVEAFPNVQFIVATHSPFMVSSLKDSKVYVLRHSDMDDGEKAESAYLPGTRRVQSIALDHANRAGTASEILRDVLGVPVTLPAWVEADLKEIVGRYQHRAIDEALLAELRADIQRAGLEDLLSDALVMLGQAR